MQKKIAIFLSVLMLVLCIPVSAGAVSVSGEVTIQTEIFSGFDITIPQSIAQKYRWSDFGYEGANGIHFYDRSKFDAAGGKSSYEEADEAQGYLLASVSTTTTAIIVTEWAIPCFMSCSSRPEMTLWPFIAGTICRGS